MPRLGNVFARAERSLWRELAEVAAIVLARRDPFVLEENVKAIAGRGGWLPRRLAAHLGVRDRPRALLSK